MFNICIHFIVYICFVFIRNPANTLFFINTKHISFFCSDQNVMTLYITIVNLNCEPLKQGLKIYMVFFIK